MTKLFTPKMTDKKISIFPTRMNQSIMETKMRNAEKGYNLLKKKSDALQIKYKEVLQQLEKSGEDAKTALKAAYSSMSQAEYLGGNIIFYANECCKSPTFLEANIDKSSGIALISIKIIQSASSSIISYGGSGSSLMKCRRMFLEALNAYIELCSLKCSFSALEEAYKSTSRRVNSLEFVMLPVYKNTLNYIFSELDEQEREDFYRLKKIQNNKQKTYA